MCHLKHDELCQSTTCPLNGYTTSNAVFEICEINYISGQNTPGDWTDGTKISKTKRIKITFLILHTTTFSELCEESVIVLSL